MLFKNCSFLVFKNFFDLKGRCSDVYKDRSRKARANFGKRKIKEALSRIITYSLDFVALGIVEKPQERDFLCARQVSNTLYGKLQGEDQNFLVNLKKIP